MPDRASGDCKQVRLARAWALMMAGSAVAGQCSAADLWGGSVGLTSDYLVRGISRSDGQPALQLDVHYSSSEAFIAGAFASSARADPQERTDAELSAFLGFAWTAGSGWHGRLLATHYGYAGRERASQYDYDELDLDLAYRDWIELSMAYSPDSPRLLPGDSLRRVVAGSADIDLHRPLIGRLSGALGVGYYRLAGVAASGEAESGPGYASAGPGHGYGGAGDSYGGAGDTYGSVGYAYGSAGLIYDVAPLSLTVTFVDAGNAARSLYDKTAAGGRWTVTAIYRF